jgi:hypothetical protein
MDYFLPEILRMRPVNDEYCAKNEPAIGTVLYSHRLAIAPTSRGAKGKIQSLEQGPEQYTLLRFEGYADDSDGFRLLLARLRETPWMSIREQNPRVLLQIYVPHSAVDLDELAGMHFPSECTPPPARGILQSVPLAGWERFVAVATHARENYTTRARCKSSTLVAVVDFVRDTGAKDRLRKVLADGKLRSLRVVTRHIVRWKQLERYKYGLQVLALSARAGEIVKLLRRKVNIPHSWYQETPGPDLSHGTMMPATIRRGTDVLVCDDDRELWRLCDKDDAEDIAPVGFFRSLWRRLFGSNHETTHTGHTAQTWSVTGSETLVRSLVQYTAGATMTPCPWNPWCTEQQQHHPNKRQHV